MRLGRLWKLRNQMLIAMGLPACWSGAGSAPVTAVPPAAVDPAGSPAVADFDPERCQRDSLPETVCGQHEARTCGPQGHSLTTITSSTLYVTATSSRPASFRDFIYDRGATHGYRDTLDEADGEPSAYCCYSRCTQLVVGAAPAAVAPPRHHIDNRCFPPPPGGTSRPEATNPVCPAGVELSNALRPYASGNAESCCYAVVVPDPERRPIRGRAARLDGMARFADVGGDTASHAYNVWRATTLQPVVEQLATDLRGRLAEAWLEAARMEHASIASFSTLSLRLLAVGAPPSLVAATHAAALDEIEHARVAFALASAYAGTPLGPARFDAAARMSTMADLPDLATLARETFVDGCIGETVAALEAEHAAEAAQDPAIAAALRQIAADEARHAELAWAIVAWCVRASEPALLDALDDELQTSRSQRRGASADADLAAHGVLGGDALWSLRTDALREVIAPCLQALAA